MREISPESDSAYNATNSIRHLDNRFSISNRERSVVGCINADYRTWHLTNTFVILGDELLFVSNLGSCKTLAWRRAPLPRKLKTAPGGQARTWFASQDSLTGRLVRKALPGKITGSMIFFSARPRGGIMNAFEAGSSGSLTERMTSATVTSRPSCVVGACAVLY